MINYPIKFEPILKEKIQGGNKLKNVLCKKTTKSNIGESWEISDVNKDISVISNGVAIGTTLRESINYCELLEVFIQYQIQVRKGQ